MFDFAVRKQKPLFVMMIVRKRCLAIRNKEDSTMKKSIWRQCTGKRRYRDEHTVNYYRRVCERERGKKLDYYWCKYCNGFHLTSKEFVWEYEMEDETQPEKIKLA